MKFEDWKENGATLVESAKENADWWINHGAVYDEDTGEWLTLDSDKIKRIVELVLIGFAEQFTALAELKEKAMSGRTTSGTR